MTEEEKKLCEGHRGRLAKKSGLEQLSPYERWEYWLGGIIPRRSMRDLAKKMYNECGGLIQILTTPYDKLIQFKGIGPTAAHQIENLRYVLMEGLYESFAQKCTIFHDNTQLRNYCKLKLGGKEIEEVHILYLASNRLLLDLEQHSLGTDNWAPVYPDRIAGRALNLHAKYLVLVHNHPTPFTSFSDEDFNMTNKIAQMLLPFHVYIDDHFVVSGGLLYSMRELPGGGQFLDGMAPIPKDDKSTGF